MDLVTLRQAIDRVDGGIARLLALRARLVAEAWAEKRGRGVPVRDPAREEVILARAARLARPVPATATRAVFAEILAACAGRRRREDP
jgi:chorismate mutase